MASRRIKKVTKRRLTIFGTLSVLIIFYFLFTLFYESYNLYKLTIKQKELKNHYTELKEEAEELKIEINQLNDPEYLAKYARENYSYSKEGEYIIKLKDTEDEIETVKSGINKEYLVIGLSILLILIFIYVIRRGHKKKKR